MLRQSKRLPWQLTLLLALPVARIDAAELGGSRASMERQHAVATRQGVPFLQRAADIREQVETQQLERIESDESLLVNEVSYPFARPEVILFVQRLATQYHEATGERLVVTSLTRPASEQPRNAHPLSVHPAGLAVDLRIPAVVPQRRWLETTLLALENRGVIDVTRERNPAHYHVAVFPHQYKSYVATLPPKKPRAAQRERAEATVTQLIAVAQSQPRVGSYVLMAAIAVATMGTGFLTRFLRLQRSARD